MTVSRVNTLCIGDMMINVNKPWVPRGTCQCQAVLNKLRACGSGWCPPTTDGHIFFTGREYRGPHATVLHLGNANIPKASSWDVKRVWEQIYSDLPFPVDRMDVTRLLDAHGLREDVGRGSFPSTSDTYQVRKVLDGLVIGPLDKNPGELWCCCPCLYEKTLNGLYSEATGYVEVFPRKVTTTLLKAHGKAGVHMHTLPSCPPARNSKGTWKDVLKSWQLLYKEKGWSKFGKFDPKGELNIPYSLYKAKNVLDAGVRRDKIHKARPIAPTIKHPMRRMLGKAGRAWYFLSDKLQGEYLDLPKVHEIPNFIDQATRQMQAVGDGFQVSAFDIEGCFPNMPKSGIKLASMELIAELMRKGYKGVWVPRARTKTPCWCPPTRYSQAPGCLCLSCWISLTLLWIMPLCACPMAVSCGKKKVSQWVDLSRLA